MSTRKKSPAPRKAATPRTPQPEVVGLEEIKGLIALVARESFAEFEFEAGEMRFRIRKEGAVAMMAPAPAPMPLGRSFHFPIA